MDAARLFRDVRAIVFDLDGTLVRTTRLKYESYRRVLAHWGCDLDYPFYQGLVGQSRRTTCRKLIKHFGIDRSWTELAAECEREDRVMRAQARIPVIPEAEAFVSTIPAAKYHRALVSSAAMDYIEWVLERTGLGQYFDTVIAGNELPQKPEPDLYLCAIEVASVQPWDAVVIEASAAGVIGAVRAGARVVAVPDEDTRRQDFSRAHVRVDSLDQLIPFLKAAAGL